jgi:ubiquinol-cytochrome c reductase iron-sulfur subunit
VSNDNPQDGKPNARRAMTFALGDVVGGVVVGSGTVFLNSLRPAANVVAPPPLDVDITKLRAGQIMAVDWVYRPIYILKRTAATIDALKVRNDLLADPDSRESAQPEGAKNPLRSLREDILVADAVCTHLGCAVSYNPSGNEYVPKEFVGGCFECPCHSSRYDLAGKVMKGMPAPRNLLVPEHEYLDASTIRFPHPAVSIQRGKTMG